MLVVVAHQLRADAGPVPAAEVAGLGHGAVQQQLPRTRGLQTSHRSIDHMCSKYDTPTAAICRLHEVPRVQAQGQLRGVGVGQQGAVISEHDLPSDMMTARVS